MWQFLKKHWVMSLFGLAICLTSAVSITWAVLTHEGDEGFLRVEGGYELKWNKENLPIGCLHDGVGTEWLQLYDKARAELKKATGIELFESCMAWALVSKPFPKRAPAGSITLSVEALDNSDHGGQTVLNWDRSDGHLVSAQVKFNESVEQRLRYRVVAHEVMGHALGLDHDRMQSSFMYPAVNVRSGKFSSPDIERLKAVYGR